MSGWKHRIFGLAMLACVGHGYGQAQVAGDAQGAVPQGRAMGKPTVVAGFRMYTLDEPFSLVETVIVTRTDPDGSVQRTETEQHAYRDGAARFRVEVGERKDGNFVVRRVTIFDPVALTSVEFAPGSATGLLTHLGARTLPTAEDGTKQPEQAVRAVEPQRTRPDANSEEALPPRVIAGEPAVGRRRTTVYPGFRQMRRTVETWSSADLKIPLLEKTDGPLGMDMGMERVQTVTELHRGEPDAGLFKLPEGMVTESAARVQGSPDLYRVGGDVSAPVALYTPEPEFSEQARKGGISGSVVIGVRIDPDGKTSHVRVIRGVGYGLDEEAMKAVSRYKFKPAMRAGVPVPVEISVEVSFKIYKKP